jgi:hypothetical protein
VTGFDPVGAELLDDLCEQHALERDRSGLPDEVTNPGKLLTAAMTIKGLSSVDARRYAADACPTWPKPPTGASTWTHAQLSDVWRAIPLAPPPHVERRVAEGQML